MTQRHKKQSGKGLGSFIMDNLIDKPPIGKQYGKGFSQIMNNLIDKTPIELHLPGGVCIFFMTQIS